jgi:hypothetical protein
MNGLTDSAISALENQAFGLMGRLHVMLRREIGRVTDIKYMSSNPEYCRQVLDMAFAIANPDLRAIGKKLEKIYFGERGLFESLPVNAPVVKTPVVKTPKIALTPSVRMPMHIELRSLVAETAVLETVESEAISNTYVGRLR